MCAEKTKLQVFATSNMQSQVQYAKNTNPIAVDNEEIKFVNAAEHVGMLRSSSGNLPTILARVTAHRKALASVLHTGMARGHRGNPAASLHVEQLYGVPVLLSGLAPLVLSKKEENLIDQHHKEVISNLQRLLPRTPRSVVCFLAGSLPGVALLHLKQLTIFGMICRLTDNILHQHALNILNFSTPSSKSWFSTVRDLCLLYCLPHPLVLLQSPMPKVPYKSMIKKKVLDYWEQVLRSEASVLPTLVFIKPVFMSLTTPHPMWSTAGSSPSKIAMATIQAQMVSGRYRTEGLCRHWSNNLSGTCLLSKACSTTIEDIPHILSTCEALSTIRKGLMDFTKEFSKTVPAIQHLILTLCNPSNPAFVQFLLDCSCIPSVITSTQVYGKEILEDLFNISRTWIYAIHKERMKILGRLNQI